MLGEVLAEVTRSEVVESVHAGHLVLLNADGSILFQKGDPTLNIYSRSSLKSIQASAMVRAGLDIAAPQTSDALMQSLLAADSKAVGQALHNDLHTPAHR